MTLSTLLVMSLIIDNSMKLFIYYMVSLLLRRYKPLVLISILTDYIKKNSLNSHYSEIKFIDVLKFYETVNK